MRPAKTSHLARLVVYGSLALGLVVALLPPQSLSRQPQHSAEPYPGGLRATHEAIIGRYLASVPGGAPAAANLSTLPDATLIELIAWLPTPPELRPGRLFETPLPADAPLFSGLLGAALAGSQAPPLKETPALLSGLPLAASSPLRLTLLQVVAERAARERQPRLQHQLLADAARHPAAAWSHVQTLIDASLASQITGDAIAVLNDWLDDPPPPSDPARLTAARLALARLQVTAGLHPDALATLRPLLKDEPAPDTAALEIAWTIASLSRDPAPLIEPIESLLRQHPQHHLHWRELACDPAPSPEYLLWLGRLASACLQSQNESRAVEAALHLARLESPGRLLPALPAAARLGRFPEVLQLLDSSPDGASALMNLAQACSQHGDHPSARQLLEHHLQRHPKDLSATRLLLEVKTRDLTPMQAALHWRRHLRQNPSDLPAQHHLIAAWIGAGQPQAAVNHLLATDPARLDTSLRLQTAQLALENRQNAAFPRAIERLIDARDPIPADSLSLWSQHLEVLKQPVLAQALR